MKRNFVANLAGATAICAGMAATIPAAFADTLTLRFSQWIPSTHFTQKDALHPFFKDVEKATEGRVRILPSAKSLGPPPRQMQITVDGIADVAWGVHGYQPGAYPLAEMADLPFLTRNAEANSIAFWRVYKAMFEKAGMHPKGVHTLSVHMHPAGQVYNNKRSIEAPGDFKGLKLRANISTVFRAFKALGAVPISPAGGVTALHQGLSKGVLDGTAHTPDAIIAFRVAKYIKYATHIPGGLYNGSFYLVMNQKKWDSISKTDQIAINKLAGEAFARRMGKVWNAAATAGVPQLKKMGIKIVEAKGPLLAKIKSVMAPMRAAWIAKATKAGVDGEAALKMFNDEADEALKN